MSGTNKAFRYWLPASIIGGGYLLYSILHWSGWVPMPLGLPAILHLIVITLFIAGCVVLILERVNERAPEVQPTETQALAMAVPQRGADARYLTDMAESVRLGREIERRRTEPPEVGV